MSANQIKLLVIALFICLLGVLTIYSGTYQKEAAGWQFIYRRQILWILIGLFLFFFFSKLNYHHLWDATYILYGISLFFLFLVFILGAVRLGAQRWLNLGWFNFQPSEVSKLVMVVFLARYFSKKQSRHLQLSVREMGITRAFILPFIFVIIPVLLIIEQPDLGSGLLVFLLFLIMLFLVGIKYRYLISLLLLGLISVPLVWGYLREYQKNRLIVFLNPNIDPLGSGYNVIQSTISIGSGGIFGKGWLAGTQSQLNFLPECHTDFVFASFSEQWGFLGVMALLLLYVFIIRIGLQIGSRTQDRFGKLLAYGICIMFSLQIFVNMAMNLGIAPIVGVPLPLMSYGGSSMLVSFTALGILANIDRKRSVF